ncbi:hypothetical protein GCM10010178_49630 [Lentzea flava]|uniref:Uncharacterized protein n=1 Tax=Lentzea flava TaxID=103732 RepID=A0ABQ2US75_9PSEU|nr:hypothetical protein GCM10010178_49630 [Lentzea flava]
MVWNMRATTIAQTPPPATLLHTTVTNVMASYTATRPLYSHEWQVRPQRAARSNAADSTGPTSCM